MAKAGPVEQFIRQTQPFLRQGPDTCMKGGVMGKATMNAHLSEKVENYIDGDVLENSKAHYSQTVNYVII